MEDKLLEYFRDKKQYLVTVLRSNMDLDSYLEINANLKWFFDPKIDHKKRVEETESRLSRLIRLYGDMDYWVQIRKDIEHAFGKIKDFFGLSEIDVYGFEKVKRRWLIHQWAIALVDVSAWMLDRPDLRLSPWKLFK